MSVKSSMRIKQKRRVGETWVSKSRLLNGSTKKSGSFGRNPNFDTDETKLLIQLWGDPKVQRTLITTHKKHAVICQLASKMQEYGYYRSAEEITTRIKNLKCFYNRLKKDFETGKGLWTSEPTWKHFAEMDAIMTRPIFSVRPNEIPAPSLKYRMEQAREERAERKKRQHEGGSVSEDSNDGESEEKGFPEKPDVDDGIIPDVEVNIDINDATFAAITGSSKSEKPLKKRKIVKSKELTVEEPAELVEAPEVVGEETITADTEGNKTPTIKTEEESDCVDSSGATEEQEPNPADSLISKDNLDENISIDEPETVKAIETKLLTPKDEPIDVDADDDVEEIIEKPQDNTEEIVDQTK